MTTNDIKPLLQELQTVDNLDSLMDRIPDDLKAKIQVAATLEGKDVVDFFFELLERAAEEWEAEQNETRRDLEKLSADNEAWKARADNVEVTT